MKNRGISLWQCKIWEIERCIKIIIANESSPKTFAKVFGTWHEWKTWDTFDSHRTSMHNSSVWKPSCSHKFCMTPIPVAVWKPKKHNKLLLQEATLFRTASILMFFEKYEHAKMDAKLGLSIHVSAISLRDWRPHHPERLIKRSNHTILIRNLLVVMDANVGRSTLFKSKW